jgi:hypothetical protein
MVAENMISVSKSALFPVNPDTHMQAGVCPALQTNLAARKRTGTACASAEEWRKNKGLPRKMARI